MYFRCGWHLGILGGTTNSVRALVCRHRTYGVGYTCEYNIHGVGYTCEYILKGEIGILAFNCLGLTFRLIDFWWVIKIYFEISHLDLCYYFGIKELDLMSFMGWVLLQGLWSILRNWITILGFFELYLENYDLHILVLELNYICTFVWFKVLGWVNWYACWHVQFGK